MFSRFKAFRTTLHWTNQAQPPVSNLSHGTIIGPAGNQVDASCNSTVTISCLRQLYNAVDYITSPANGNELAVTGYLEEYANNMDLQQFYLLENPPAFGSNYTFVSIHGLLQSKFRPWLEC